MLFSIIIPVYKVEKYLHQCVDSVLMQDFNDYELILVDDGSPDRCPEICDEYAAKDSKVVVIHKTNGGASDARNAGILKARGEYVCFLDSDDYWRDTHALSLVGEKAKSDNTDLICWGGCHLYSDGSIIVKGTERDFSGYEGLNGSEIVYKLVSDGKLYLHPAIKAIRRSFLLSNNLLFKKGITSEDLEWNIRLLILEPSWSFLKESFYVYRVNREGSVTATVSYRNLDILCQIIEDSIKLVKGCNPKTKEALMSYLMYQVMICNALISKTDLTNEQRKNLHKRLKSICKEYLLKYQLNKKVQSASLVYRIFGYFGLSKVLGFYLTHRSR